MKNKKSFSENIKYEILSYDWSKKMIRILFHAFVKINLEKKDKYFLFKTTQKDFKNKIIIWFREIYSVEIKLQETKELLKIFIYDKDFENSFFNNEKQININSKEEYGVYIAGLFLGKGWINSPKSKFYHFEIRTKDIKYALNINEIFNFLEIKILTVYKNGWYYLYLKKGSDIVKILNLMKANNSFMLFENERIQRDFIATYTKMEAIEPYNLSKILRASKEQIIYLQDLLASSNIKLISKNQKELAKLRIENPSISLFDLSLMFHNRYNRSISKSTVNNWLNEMVNIAKKGKNK